VTKYQLLVSQHDDVAFEVIKYLIISQHDDSYTTLDKMRHLLVDHYVKADVQSSLNEALGIKMQVQKLYLHYN